MNKFTKEQQDYISHIILEDTRLIASAGSGKTKCIISRMNFIIENKMLLSEEVLMLTFSRFTRDDFITKVKKSGFDTIIESQIKTIDSFAKYVIDENNEIDVSLLSYKFMKYLEDSDESEIKSNVKLNQIKTIFVDEAQDLNEIQYKILFYLKQKNGATLSLIGDPNQNIYQFRKSSDKYLREFQSKTFYLTKCFRSCDPIIEFSKHLRPFKDREITGNLGKSKCLPNFVFHENDAELEKHLLKLLSNAKESKIDFSDIAILAPTRGRMLGYGKSHGLCLISNLLYKNKIKFKQFYEESTDDQQTGIKYLPEKGHINILTYMGSKGLEWKCVILIDTNICLINKRYFSEEKHKADQYLLYVACSRAINNMVIFSKHTFNEGNLTFQLNPWFEEIPKECYVMDQRLEKFFKYPALKPRDMGENERRITKILDKLDEKTLDELAQICKYGKIDKECTKIFDKDYSVTLNSNMFLGKYVENLFFVYYSMKNGAQKKRYPDIENIINKRIITDVSSKVSEWYYKNKNDLSWEEYDKNKGELEKIITDTVENKFNRNQPLNEHTIVNDGYFKAFILSLRNRIEENYKKYLSTDNGKKIRIYLFNIMVIMYSLDTQHYFHALSKGKKFKDILVLCNDMFNKIREFAETIDIVFESSNVLVNRYGLLGEIDFLSEDNHIWEIKCTSDISLKHMLQVLMYNILHFDLENYDISKNDNGDDKIKIHIRFINFLKGEKLIFTIPLTKSEILRIKEIFLGTISENKL